MSRKFVASLLLLVFCRVLSGCQTPTGGTVTGNDSGSQPINESEKYRYQSALLKCYKTGGSRIVKIEGSLRCY
ncbi:MAG: hypothetical protein AB7T49_12890 [Oligoflexales bacterium]